MTGRTTTLLMMLGPTALDQGDEFKIVAAR
jgi:hypothetical protein